MGSLMHIPLMLLYLEGVEMQDLPPHLKSRPQEMRIELQMLQLQIYLNNKLIKGGQRVHIQNQEVRGQLPEAKR